MTNAWRLARLVVTVALGLVLGPYGTAVAGTPVSVEHTAEAVPDSPLRGPGIPRLSFRDRELYEVIGVVDRELGVRHGHSLLAMHRGYLVVVGSQDGGKGDGNFAFYDLSDIRHPRLVARYDSPLTQNLREAHTYGFTRVDGRDVVVLLARDGLQYWDWTDVRQARRLSELKLLPMKGGDYASTAWWLAIQGPYVYVGGADTGLHIVDGRDPEHPRRVAHLPVSQTGGFRIGPTFAVGNLLVLSSMDLPGVSTFDIQDPRQPRLLTTAAETVGYSALFNGGRLYAIDTIPKVWDLSDPSRIKLMGRYKGPALGSKGGYGLYQDGFLHQGVSNNYAKVDVRDPTDPKLVGKVRSGVPGSDLDGGNVLGNFAFASCDHSKGSFIAPHATEPDALGPAVTMVEPGQGATGIMTSARIGLTLSDQVDGASVHEASFQVRELGGEPLAGRYSSQIGIVNFWPEHPLRPGTTYEILVPEGGLRDYAGNSTQEAFRSLFSTGVEIGNLHLTLHSTSPVEVGKWAHFSVTPSSVVPETLYSWDFGDGSDPTPFSAEIGVTHRYQGAGHFAVVVRGRRGERRGGTSTIQTVHWPLTDPRPTHSSTVALDEGLGRAWNVNPDNDSVTATDLGTLARLFEVDVPAHPRTLALDPTGKVWVVSQDRPAVSVLDGETGRIQTTIPLRYGSRPYGVAVSPDGRKAYVATQGSGKVMRIDTASRSVDATLSLGGKLRGVAVAADGNSVYVTRFVSPTDQGEVIELDAMRMEELGRFELASDQGPDREDSGRGVPNYLSSLTLSPDARRAWVPSKKDNTGRGLVRDGQQLSFESTVRTIVSQLDLAAGREVLAARRDLNDRDMATAVVLSPLGDFAFVATQGTNTVEILDAYDGSVVSAILRTGLAPQGLAMTQDGGRLWVHNFLSRSLAIYDTTGVVAGFKRPAQRLAVVETVSKEKLPPEVLAGKQVFYNADSVRMNRDGYVSCASCHLDGGSDGRVWDFTDRGEGLRNTIELNGRSGLGHGRLHWSANFDEVQDFEHDIRVAFGGAGFLGDEDYRETRHPLAARKAGRSLELDSLAAYLSSLDQVPDSPYRNADGTLSADGALGRELFRALDCASCHGGAGYTDSPSGVLHDVGSLARHSGGRLGGHLLGVDTPTLRGLWDTAPYLHDGSAHTLMDVLTRDNMAARHGSMAGLTPEEKDRLVAFLLQIDERETAAQRSRTPIEITAVQVEKRARGGTPVVTLRIQPKEPRAGITRVELYAANVRGHTGFQLIAQTRKLPYTFRWKRPRWPETLFLARARLEDGSASTSPEVRISIPLPSQEEGEESTTGR